MGACSHQHNNNLLHIMLKLSPHFTLEEMIRSKTAELHDIDNSAPDYIVSRLRVLCNEVLEPARTLADEPFIITSGYRCEKLNKLVGGVPNSFHLKGMAADIKANGTNQARFFGLCLLKQNLTDKVIVERRKKTGSVWVHVQWTSTPRHKFLELSV